MIRAAGQPKTTPGEGASMTDKATSEDILTLRFDGEDGNGDPLHELRAAHVAEVLQGLVGLTSDFEKAGVFHEEGPAGSEVLVRPAREGSFVIEVLRTAAENWEATAAATGGPSIATVIWWATKSIRAEVKDFDHLDNGNVKVTWQDDTAEEIPVAAWRELQKHKRRRKKQLRQIMAPLSDARVTELDVTATEAAATDADQPAEQDGESRTFSLNRSDYDATRPDDDIQEQSEVFETEARMSAIDFDDSTKWRVRTPSRTRSVTVEDREFLGRVTQGLAISPKDTFWLRIRQDATTKDGRTTTKWTVEKVEMRRRAASDDATSQEDGPSPS